MNSLLTVDDAACRSDEVLPNVVNLRKYDED
jgi:hypothetical protein